MIRKNGSVIKLKTNGNLIGLTCNVNDSIGKNY